MARALVKGEHGVTVWNWTTAKARPLADLGAKVATTVSAAVTASPVVLVCVDSYRSTSAMFDIREVTTTLPDRTIVQMTSGTPSEARAAASRFAAKGAVYLDAGILGSPPAIGTQRVTILYL